MFQEATYHTILLLCCLVLDRALDSCREPIAVELIYFYPYDAVLCPAFRNAVLLSAACYRHLPCACVRGVAGSDASTF